jgi:hypothetical protein
MQIIKNIKNVETGYYIVLAVHADVAKEILSLLKQWSLERRELIFL